MDLDLLGHVRKDMVKPGLTREKAARAESWLNDLESILSKPDEEFRSSIDNRDLASFYLFLSLQECIDLTAYWIVDAEWTVPPDAASAFEVLTSQGVIDRDLAVRLRDAVAMRDRIARGDLISDYARLQSEFRGCIASLRRFLAAIADRTGL